MPFVTRCPYCRFGVKVPDRAMAASVKCPGCQSWYTATPDSDPTLGRAPEAPVPKTAASATKPEPEPTGGTATATAADPQPTPVATSVPVAAPLELHVPTDAEESTNERRPHPLGIAACFVAAAALFAAALPATALLTRPLAAAGLVLGTVGALVVSGGSPVRMILPVLGAAVGGLTLLVSLFVPSLLGPAFEASRQKSDYDPDAVRAVALNIGPDGTDGLEADGYADASRAAVQQGSVRVQVVSATVGPVRVVDGKRRTTKQSLLAVTVRVQHLGHGENMWFAHWGVSVGDRTVPPAAATAGGRTLAPPDLGTDVPVGVTHTADLSPGRAIEDLLVFEPPSGPGPVRLELPAEAWGGRGTVFKFQIPGSMIVTQPAKKPR